MKNTLLIGVLCLIPLGCGRGGLPQVPFTCAGDFCYQEVEGLAQVEGDIVVGMALRTGFSLTPGLNGARWPNGIVPYAVDPNLPRPERVRQAIEHFQRLTNVRFRPRTTQGAYVIFRPWTQGY